MKNNLYLKNDFHCISREIIQKKSNGLEAIKAKN